jgi:hypothetical protein
MEHRAPQAAIGQLHLRTVDGPARFKHMQVSGVACRRTQGKKVTEHPLSYGQRALWFVHQMDRSSTAYNVHIAFRIP